MNEIFDTLASLLQVDPFLTWLNQMLDECEEALAKPLEETEEVIIYTRYQALLEVRKNYWASHKNNNNKIVYEEY